jgi:AdoMet-dependent heme synthase
MKLERNLKLVFWETTAACNLSCNHCRRLDDGSFGNDLSTKDACLLIDSIAETGKPVLVFSGGEPLLRPDLPILAACAKAKGLTIALATNGTLLDSSASDSVYKMHFDRVSISLDGAISATHDAFRNQVGSFDKALEGCFHLKEKKVSFQINTTVTKHNESELEAVYDLVKKIGADAWHLFMFVPVGCGLFVPAEQQLAAKQYEDVLSWVAGKASCNKPFVRATCAPQFFRILSQRNQLKPFASSSQLSSMTKGCLAGSHICFISHAGEVFPCGYLPVSCGNVLKEPFKQIWENSNVLREISDPDLLKGKCGACDFKHVCAGCRARAYAAGSGYMAEEPCCAYQPV